jgi:ATP-binding cassette subfamily A (ABC1) protein 3
VYLQNQVAEKGNSELYQNVGICPQFDCLWADMNPVEHLKIFARLKGLKGNNITEAAEYFMRIM